MSKVRRKPPLTSPIYSIRLRTPGDVERLRRALRQLAEVMDSTQADALTFVVNEALTK